MKKENVVAVSINGKESTKEEYLKFMYNEKNIMNCSECPSNEGFSNWDGKLPCGQQNCWVRIHCEK